MPEPPLVNRDVKIIVELSDTGLGVDPLRIQLKLGGIPVVLSSIPLNWTYTISPQTYTAQFNTVMLTITANVKARENTTLPLEVVVYDNAGNSAVYVFNITFVAPVKTTTTPTTPATQPTQPSTSPQPTTTSPVESSTLLETTTTPTTSPPSQPSPSTSTPPIQTSSTPVAPVTTVTVLPAPPSATPATQLVILVIAVIAVIAIIITAVLLARR